jgi:hypothetical protein
MFFGFILRFSATRSWSGADSPLIVFAASLLENWLWCHLRHGASPILLNLAPAAGSAQDQRGGAQLAEGTQDS